MRFMTSGNRIDRISGGGDVVITIHRPALPVKAGHSRPAAAHHACRRLAHPILLVDDEPALTNLLKMALHYEG